MFKRVKEEIKETQIIETFKQASKELLTGDEASLETLNKLTIDWRLVLQSFEDEDLISATIVIAVFFLVTTYLLFLSYFSISDIINEFMMDNAKYGFLSNLIANLGKSALFALLFLAITLPFNAAIFALTYLLYLGLSKLLSFLVAIPFVIIFLLVAFAFQNTVLCCWLPAITRDGLSVVKALKVCFANVKKRFGEAFGLFFTINFLSLIWFYLCVIPTFGAGIIIAVPSVILIKKCTELVFYYNVKGYKYYVEKDQVVQGNI